MPTFPLLVCPVVASPRAATFYLLDRRIELEIPRRLTDALVPLCDGTRSAAAIVHALHARFNASLVEQVIDTLLADGALVDSRQASVGLWPLLESPGPFPAPGGSAPPSSPPTFSSRPPGSAAVRRLLASVASEPLVRVERVAPGVLPASGDSLEAAVVLLLCADLALAMRQHGSRGLVHALVAVGRIRERIEAVARDAGMITHAITDPDGPKSHATLGLPPLCRPVCVLAVGLSSRRRPTPVVSGAPFIRSLVMERPPPNEGYQRPFAYASCVVVGRDGRPFGAGGSSRTPALARVKAVAEAVERVACEPTPDTRFITARLRDIHTRAVHPESLARYATGQLGAEGLARPFDPEGLYQWREAIDAASGARRLVLADFVHYPYHPTHAPPYWLGNSSGCAAHTTPERALLSGLRELIEREAFMVAWHNRLRRRRIALPSLPERERRRVREFALRGFQLSVVDLTLDLSPVVMVVAMRRDPPGLLCSSSCADDVEDALDHALMEAENLLWSRLGRGRSTEVVAPHEVWTLEHHLSLYEARENLPRAAFLLGGPEQVSLRTLARHRGPKTLDANIAALRARGLSLLSVDPTEGDPNYAKLPYRVARALVPEMVPIAFDAGLAPLGMPRLRALPVSCGLRRTATPVGRLYRFPHPYA